MNDSGVSMEKLSRAVAKLITHIPPISEQEIYIIKSNQRLSLISKFRIIRKAKKTIRANQIS